MTPPVIVQNNVQLIAASVKREFKPYKPVELFQLRLAKFEYAMAGPPSPKGFLLRLNYGRQVGTVKRQFLCGFS
jgi:hypothetical protein